MELGAFIAPSTGFIDTYKAANFNKYSLVIGSTKDGNNEYVPSISESSLINALEYLERKNQTNPIDVQIQLHHNLVRANYNVFTEAFPNIDFKDYPSVKGFYLLDEPNWSQIDYLDQNYVQWFNDNYASHGYEFYVNMLGGYSSYIGPVRDADGNVIYENGNKLYDNATEEQKKVCYEVYLNKFLAMFAKVNSSNKYFTIDAYPLLDNQVGLLTMPGDELPADYERILSESWLHTTLKAAKTADANSYTFGAFIQACDEGGEDSTRRFRLPTKVEEIKWQAYMNMAFGAKKLTYYGYDNSGGGTYMTIVGEPLPLYYLVQETNAELDKIDHVIASFTDWVGVKTFLGTNSNSNTAFDKIADMELSALTGVSSVVSSRDLVVGEMVDGSGNHGYMLVGYDDPFNQNETEVNLTFDGADGLIIYRNGQRYLSEDLVDGNYSVTLSAGEGVFIIPVYAD